MLSPPRVLFVYPSSFHYPAHLHREEVKSPLLALASYAARFFPVEYLDFELVVGRPDTDLQIKRFERRVGEELSKREFDVLAISCWTSLSFTATMSVAKVARRLFPDKLIIVGGYHPTARPNDFLTPDPLFDYVILAEAELTLREILGGTLNRPPRTEVLVGQTLQPSDFTPLNWSLVDPMVAEFAGGRLETLNIFLSRGCPFECTFCMESLKDSTWRAFPVESAIAEVTRAAERYSFKALGIGDACFGLRRDWRKEFLRRLHDLKPDYWILFETRPEFLEDDDIRLLADLKVEIQFGLESGSPRMLELMKKSRRPAQYLDSFAKITKRLSAYGIPHGANLIFNHPGETKTTVDETFRFMDSLTTNGQSSMFWSCHTYLHFPGCHVDREQKYYEDEFGAEFHQSDWWRADSNPQLLARQVTPSRDLAGDDTNYWLRQYKDREESYKASLQPLAFKLAAQFYYPQWQNDPRYLREVSI